MQTQSSQYAGAIDCAKRILAKEGFFGFYKGTATPLVGVGACVSIQFGTFEFMKRQLRRDSPTNRSSAPHLTMGDFYIAGGTAGVANCIVACMCWICGS